MYSLVGSLARTCLNLSGYDVNQPAQIFDNLTPLMVSVKTGDPGCVQEILKVPGIDVNIQEPRDGVTALMVAAQYGKNECLDLLLQVPGIDVNIQNNDGETALNYSISNYHEDGLDCFMTLIDTPNINVDLGNPLMTAVIAYNVEIVKKLLQKGANVYYPNRYYTDPLLRERQSVLALAVTSFIRLNKRAVERGETPPTTEIITLLLKQGIENSFIDTALKEATENGSQECIDAITQFRNNSYHKHTKSAAAVNHSTHSARGGRKRRVSKKANKNKSRTKRKHSIRKKSKRNKSRKRSRKRSSKRSRNKKFHKKA